MATSWSSVIRIRAIASIGFTWPVAGVEAIRIFISSILRLSIHRRHADCLLTPETGYYRRRRRFSRREQSAKTPSPVGRIRMVVPRKTPQLSPDAFNSGLADYPAPERALPEI